MLIHWIEQELKYYADKWDQFLHKWKPLLSSLQQQEKKIHLLQEVCQELTFCSIYSDHWHEVIGQLDDLETLLSQGIHQELGKSSRLDPVSLQRCMLIPGIELGACLFLALNLEF